MRTGKQDGLQWQPFDACTGGDAQPNTLPLQTLIGARLIESTGPGRGDQRMGVSGNRYIDFQPIARDQAAGRMQQIDMRRIGPLGVKGLLHIEWPAVFGAHQAHPASGLGEFQT